MSGKSVHNFIDEFNDPESFGEDSPLKPTTNSNSVSIEKAKVSPTKWYSCDDSFTEESCNYCEHEELRKASK